jgi:hypothetical protein
MAEQQQHSSAGSLPHPGQDDWHDGVPLPVTAGERVVARWDGTEVVLVTADSGLDLREAAAKVALRAQADTPFHEPPYSLTDPDPNVHVFLARQGGRAVGLVVLRPRPRWGWWSWDDYDAERRPAHPVAPLTSWTVESVWALGRVQQQGIARRVLEVAASVVDRPIASFGWRRPFTPSGEAFVRRMCPEGFWVPD